MKSLKTALLDKHYSIRFVTDESSAMALGVLDADVLVRVNVEIAEWTSEGKPQIGMNAK